jgi:hypothetical protein
MQKDYMAMAQGQQAPAAPQQAPMGQQAPVGNDERGAVVENLTLLAEQAGLFQARDMDQEQLQKDIQELADLIMADDQAGMEKNKLYKIISIMFEETEKMQAQQAQPTGGAVPQGAPGATKDFASMMPPTPGGGMGGR